MKKVFKFFSVVFLFIIAFMLGVLYKENESAIKDSLPILGNVSENEPKEETQESGESNIQTLRDLPFYNKYYGDGLLEEMASNKNKDYEMEVGVYETYDEMVAEYIKTFVSIKADFYDSNANEMRFGVGSGNIYDIDDEYMYIITCLHIMSNDYNDEIKEFYIRFVDDTRITISSDYLYLREDKKDIALIKIPLSFLSSNTLDVVKTININNVYNIPLDEFYDSTLYCFRYRDLIYNVSYVENIEQQGEIFTLDCNIEKGTSGGGVVDINGNYYTLMLNQATLNLQMLYFFNDLLIQAKQ